MAGNKDKRYYWFKLSESFMNSDVIDYIMEQKRGAEYVLVYQMLCLKTINTGGRLVRTVGNLTLGYDEKRIARDIKWFNAEIVREALCLFKSAGLIRKDAEGVWSIADFQDLIGSETESAARMREARAIRREEGEADRKENAVSDVRTMCEQCANIDKEERKNQREKKKETEIREQMVEGSAEGGGLEQTANDGSAAASITAIAAPCPVAEIIDLYHSSCPSFPKIRSVSGDRLKAVKARWRQFPSLGTFKELFELAELSDFMKGQNARNWTANFDWMMNANNFSKILEHRYDQTRGKSAKAEKQDSTDRSYDLDLFFNAAIDDKR